MAKIQELSALLADQIAAGEVVERPASVVKELVENAIDAHSTQIDVIIEEAGLKKIRVIDNGDGIEPEDALIAFKRHATSKLYSREDLFRIKTLGFRGEALPSIASVSHMTLETSTGDNIGTYVYLKAGKVEEHRAHSARKGTSLSVEQLFFNTPARLKFVSSLQRETANIADLINRLALSHPHISFSLLSDGHRLIKTLGNGQLQQTIAGVYTPAIARSMKAFSHQNLDFKISGFTSLPELTRSNRNYMSIFINGRYVKNYAINNAIIDGYESKLMVGRFPITVINIEMDYSLVDVNVHPTKQQVRISQEKELALLIKEAISQVMNTTVRIPSSLPKRFSTEVEQVQLQFDTHTASDMNRPETVVDNLLTRTEQLIQQEDYPLVNDVKYQNKLKNEEFISEQNVYYDHQNKSLPENQFAHSNGVVQCQQMTKEQYNQHEKQHGTGSSDQCVDLNGDKPFNQSSTQNGKHSIQYAEPNEVEHSGQYLGEVQEQHKVLRCNDELEKENTFPELHYFGQMHGTYLFAENEHGLYIVDQHAAQERIKYEYYRVEIGKVGTQQQGLLVPIVLHYPANEYMLICQLQKQLEDIHLYIKDFGQNSFLLEEHPTWIKDDVEQTVRDLIATLLDTGSVSIAKFREDTAIMMSCKKSIKANHYLDDEQARTLLADLSLCQNPYNCPHGRPVLIHLTNTDMEKMFKRIQDR
ncbi:MULTISPECIES: DNA mismatch repair endonuclease MutL [unclassified Granulicatella]|uniref:DNA mismatch repair endonuclease MutL n=1 Tax=unclassified Granulicatella TaxID=2630493 RepID=UPI001073B611|nr:MULTISPECIES: DNA mismatch repair endonuclease MutL [unclassified Granulicatella]MBF0779949.1 DNA mismatch repair endonuclease MutL [Granulicatella sp. 19428wC4_WM01]TFU95965.1 DNA mismatch repair endonuclease MutL [Granulicatella sp. WM01]